TFYEQDLQTLRDQLAPYLLQQNAPVVKTESSPVSSTAPTPSNSDALLALNNENAKLKTENARLRNRPIRTIVVRPTPLACPSIAQVLFPSQINAVDCDALTGAQRSVDIANEQVREFLKTKGDQSMNNLNAV